MKARTQRKPRASSKATPTDRTDIARFEDLPNVGKATAADFRLLGFRAPGELIGQDPFELYDRLCRLTKTRQDPCVLDVFMAVTTFMNGGPPRPWWDFTEERKLLLEKRRQGPIRKGKP